MAETEIQSAEVHDMPAVLALADASSSRRPSKFRIAVLALLVLNTAIIIFVGSVLMGVLSTGPGPAKPAEPAHVQNAAQSKPAQVEVASPALSWPRAEQAFAGGDYKQALEGYRSLRNVAVTIPSELPIADYLLFRQCQCMQALGQHSAAREALATLTRSNSPAIVGAASGLLATYEANEGMYQHARQLAYQAIAAIGSAQRSSQLLADCEFLIARCLTQQAYSLAGWQSAQLKPLTLKDPFAGLDEPSLRLVLVEDSSRLSGASLRPAVQKLPGQGFVKKYSAACAQVSLEDFLNCLSASAGVEISWESVSPAVRGRAVTLAFEEATYQQLAEVAAGQAGLVARFTGLGIAIHDPAVDSTTQQREILTAEAMSAWRRIFLRLGDDPRISEGHYSLACLYGCAGDTSSMIAECRLIVERFPLSQLAPEALLQSAQARVSLGDYAGASKDLTDILDSYPGFRLTDSAYLELGNVTMKAGRTDEAIRNFQKLYHLNLSPASRSQAALRLGQCYFQQADFKNAAQWLAVFTTKAQAQTSPSEGLSEAYMMLGQSHSALGNVGQAVDAYRSAIESAGQAQTNIQASLELTKELLKSEQYAAALACLHHLESQKLNAQQEYACVALNIQVLRAAHLPEKAGALLKSKLPAIVDPQLRCKATVELARCRAESGDLAGARALLADTLPQMEAGPEASQAACELADVCLRGGQHTQAITVARELLKTNCTQAQASKAREILSAAYLLQHDYENAAVSAAATPTPTSAPASAPAMLAKGQEARP
jgi:tetratricopeptide (TPR) repeat protein